MAEHKVVYQDADGVRRTLIMDDERPDRVVVKTEQVLDEILAGVERDRELHRPGSDIKLAARLPIEIFEMMRLQGWGPDDEKKWLNSSEAAPWRIWRGSL